MPRPFEITIHETHHAFVEEFTRVLEGEAEVHEPPADFSGHEVLKLIVEVLSDTGKVVGGAAAAYKVLCSIRDLARARAKSKRMRIKVLGDGTDIALVDATDADLHKLAEESQKSER